MHRLGIFTPSSCAMQPKSNQMERNTRGIDELIRRPDLISKGDCTYRPSARRVAANQSDLALRLRSKVATARAMPVVVNLSTCRTCCFVLGQIAAEARPR